MSFPIKQTFRKHFVTIHKRDETLSHLYTLFNVIYKTDSQILTFFLNFCKSSPMALKTKYVVNSKLAAGQKAAPDCALSSALKQWELENKTEACNSRKTLLQMTALTHEVDEPNRIAETQMFSLLNEGGLAHFPESDPSVRNKVLTINTE